MLGPICWAQHFFGNNYLIYLSTGPQLKSSDTAFRELAKKIMCNGIIFLSQTPACRCFSNVTANYFLKVQNVGGFSCKRV